MSLTAAQTKFVFLKHKRLRRVLAAPAQADTAPWGFVFLEHKRGFGLRRGRGYGRGAEELLERFARAAHERDAVGSEEAAARRRHAADVLRPLHTLASGYIG